MLEQMIYVQAAVQERRNEVERLLKESQERRQIKKADEPRPKHRAGLFRSLWATRQPARDQSM